ncbi:MAG: GlsB/YeaQ/YmgE family stress response membrane protein [Actinomycetota bacterium]
MLILYIVVLGLAAGWLANLILGGGSRPSSWGELLAAGLIGSFVGGLLASLIAGDGLEVRATGLIGSVVGAVIVLVIWRGVRSGRSAS